MNEINKYEPPKIAELILRIFLRYSHKQQRIDDFEEIFVSIVEQDNLLKAKRWYWIQTFRSLPGLIKNQILWGGAMFKNYMKISFRNLLKFKGYSFINIIGLAVGLSSTILILLWVQDELSFDQFHEKANRTYRICSRIEFGNTLIDQTQTAAILPITLKKDFPEVEQTVKMGFPISASCQYEDKIFMESNILPADSTFFDVFSFELIMGDKKSALNKPGTIVITEATAHRYFGSEDPNG